MAAAENIKIDKAPLLLIGCWTLATGLVSLSNPVLQNTDVISFIKMANRLKVGDPSSWLDGFCTVGFPFLIRIFSLVTGDYLAAGRLVVLVFGAVGLYLIYRIGLEIFDRPAALSALVFTTVNPVYFQFSTAAMTDLPALVFQMAGFYFLVRGLQEDRRARFILAGGMLGLGYLIRYSTLLLLPAAFVILLIYSKGFAVDRLKNGVLFFSFFVLGALPQLFSATVAKGSPFWNLEMQNVYYGIFGEQDYGIVFRQARFQGGLLDIIRIDPPRFFRNFLANLGSAAAIDHAGIPITILGWAGLIAAAVKRRWSRKTIIGLIFALTLTAGVSLAFVVKRLLIVWGPLLCLSAASSIHAAIGASERIRKKALAAGVAVGILASVNAVWFILPQLSKSDQDRALMAVSDALHADGMSFAREVLSFSFIYYDAQSPLKERFAIPWFLPQAPPFQSLDHLVAFMRVNGYRYLVFDDSAVQNVRGLKGFWPLKRPEPYFQLMLQRSSPFVTILRRIE